MTQRDTTGAERDKEEVLECRQPTAEEKKSFSLALCPFFRNSANKLARILRLGIKKIKIFCSALDFS
jgi:hypothetical protein